MQNNSNNNETAWRQRLNDFEDSPGKSLNKEAAWEKLQSKQLNKSTTGNLRWYWIAAAALFAFVCFTLLNRPSAPIVSIPVTISNKETKATLATATATEMVRTIAEADTGEQLSIIIKAEPVKSLPTVEKRGFGDTAVVLKSQPIASAALALVDSISVSETMVIAAPVKLKVVHINEINIPQKDVASEEGKPYFPFSYQTKQVFTNTNQKKGRDQLIRIKLN